MSSPLISRVSLVADTAVWVVKLNAWWWLLTLLGLGLFGAGPATAAAAIAVRRHGQGEAVRFTDLVRTYRTEFVGANLIFTPPFIMLALLTANLLWFAERPGLLVLQVITVAAMVIIGVAYCLLGPLYAFYDLPRRRYFTRAIRITLAWPHRSVMMIVVTAAIAFAGSKIIMLIPVVAVGLWLHTCTWLGLRFFAENERRLAAGVERRHKAQTEFPLPSEPLRPR